jgi:Undecaprenyl-phosphate glucose phosphotransferase
LLLTRLPLDHFGLDASLCDLEPPAVAEFSKLNLHGRIAALACLDVVGAAALFLLMFGLEEPAGSGGPQLLACLVGFLAAWGAAAHSQGLYQHRMALSGRRMLARAMSSCVIAFGIVLLLTVGVDLVTGPSRLWLLAWTAASTLWVVATRLLWHRHLHLALRGGRCLDRALVLAGSEPACRRVSASVEDDSEGRVRVVGARPMPGLPGGPPFAWIEDAVRGGLVDRVLIADFEDAKDETNALLARLMRLAVDVTLMPSLQGLYTSPTRADRIGGDPAIDVALRPLTAGQALCKRVEDVCVAGAAVLLLLPVLPLIALAIKLDSPGPVLFRQKRVGYHESTFDLLKFRSMRHEMQDEGSLRQTSRGDDRVTRVGRLLRRTSLDELPQLINVLRGEMSVVGPRPHALQMTAAGLPMSQTLDEYVSRHRIKPGITGWAQINGCRGEVHTMTKLGERIALDCYYIENWSLVLDAWIMLRTLLLLVSDRHAY